MLNIILSLLSLFAVQDSSALIYPNHHKVTLNYIEYNRGMSFPTRAQIGIVYPGHYDLTFHDVRMIDNSFYPDGFVIPNAFLKHLFKGDFRRAISSFTEPYYGIRFYHFFKNRPNLGIGIEFVHLKVFIPDEGETVLITGEDENGKVEEKRSTKEYIQSYNVSHGVNHLSFSLVYRLMLWPSEKIRAGRIQPYGAFSIGPCIPHPQLRLVGDDEYKAYGYQFRLSNFGLGFNLGTRFQILEHFGFYIEYKYTQTYLNEMRFDNSESGEIWTRFPDHHLVWGLSIVF